MNKMYKYVTAIVLMIVSINFASAISQPYHDVVQLVTTTKLLIEQDAEKAFTNINENGATTPYIFVLNMDLVTVAHGYQPEGVGTSNKGNLDSDGKDYTAAMLRQANNNGNGWVDYIYTNPATGKDGKKLAYIEKVVGSDGNKYIVGSGFYTK